ncbi:MAG: translation initiation factor IF-3 [Eubacterium sp.]|nr:translation initiation factor IF-3 [Eubacterium sp.]
MYGRFAFVHFLLIFAINLRKVFFIGKDAPQLNGEIKDKEVRVVSDTGEQLGIMSSKDAQKIADSKGVDLVKIAPQAKPPVVKIMDYSKYRYEQSKREKENRKKQKTIETKEIRLSINIDIGDFNTKVNQARKFLSKGDKVKVSIRLRGREMAHADLAENNCMRFAEELVEDANVDKKPKLEGRQVLMFLSPRQSNK